MKIYCQWFLILFPIAGWSEIIRPEQNDTLNYIHNVFEWEQMADVNTYNLFIYEQDVDVPIVEIVDTTLAYILTSGLNWGDSYTLEVCDNTLEFCTDPVDFSISNLPVNIQEIGEVEVHIYDSTQVSQGISLLDFHGTGNAFAIDILGNPVWFADNLVEWFDNENRGIVITQFLPNGNILGLTRSVQIPGHAYEMNVHNQIVWESDGDLEGIGVHHDVIQLSNGNVMVLVSQDVMLPVPDFDWPFEVPDSILWRGDRIVEWDGEGNEIWSWSVFDYFTQEDWDYVIFLQAFGLGFYDWTHSNAIWFDDVENAVYLSVRHLSRITKIDYFTGEILWNMGKEYPGEEVSFGQDLNFSWQHSIKMLENGNLMLFDNGNENDPPVSRGLEIAVNESDSIPTAEIVWEYVLEEDLSSSFQSDCDRLENGNSLLTSTDSEYIVEVNPEGETVWEIQPGQGISTYRSERVPGLYPLVFSILQPDFINDGYQSLYSPMGIVELNYTVFNEGWLNQKFTFTIEDEQGWYSDFGAFEINSNEYTELIFMNEILNTVNDNLLTLSVFPESSPEMSKTSELHLFIYASQSGDANVDGVVDIQDILIVVAVILDEMEIQPHLIDIADLNQDYEIDIFDIVLLINIILDS